MKEKIMADLFGTLDDFYASLAEVRGAQPLDLRLVKLLAELQNKNPETLSENAQKVLLVYFSLVADGNTCASLNAKKLFAKWEKKWNGLVTQAKAHADENAEQKFAEASDFQKIFENGCEDLLRLKSGAENLFDVAKLPLKIQNMDGEPWLFTDKFWKAKEVIREVFADRSEKAVFRPISKFSDAEIENCQKEICEISNVRLKKAQAWAVLCGQNSNLIVTGGPGTGKTTVVQFLLWKLLEKHSEEMRNWNLYFVAPSGKAANRLNEIRDLEDISVAAKALHPDIVEKFKRVEGQTMHRLLKFRPAENAFAYNRANRFPKGSIFVVDEASMIDLTLFAAFIQALPENPADYRLFVLGDKDQLPSVGAGAVLGELLELRNDAVVKLVESNRFPDDSTVGRLAKAIQNENSSDENSIQNVGVSWESSEAWTPSQDSVQFVSLLKSDENLENFKRKDLESRRDLLLKKWAAEFCMELPKLAVNVHPENKNPDLAELDNRKRLWTAAEKARILSAERRGVLGVIAINQKINEFVRNSLAEDRIPARYFPGQILMFNRNQNMYRLYNGDSGVVVKANGIDFLMLKSGSEFPCYPLSFFPSDALESAFAITVHKSQGSGYSNILMFLPLQSGHPLLNRQILYTGVTRTKMNGKTGSLTLVSTEARLLEAQRTTISRDTGLGTGCF